MNQKTCRRLIIQIRIFYFQYLALFSGNDDIFIAAAALFRRAVDATAGVHDIAHQIPVRCVGGRHDRQVQRQLQQLLHSLTNKP